MGHSAPAEQRFWHFVIVDDGNDGCWPWGGGKSGGGYGSFAVDSRDGERGATNVKAHRWSYEHFVGPVPDGLELDHLCRNRGCVNPAHLEPVTHLENVRRGSRCGTRLTHCKRGHEFTPENTYTRKDGARICRSCHREHVRACKERRRLALSPSRSAEASSG